MLSYFFIQGKKHFVVATGKQPLKWKDNLAEISSFSLFQISDTSNELYFFLFFLPLTISPNAFSDVLVLVEQHGRSEKAETYIAPNKRIKKIVSIFLFLCWLPIPITRDLKHQDGRERRRLSGSKITAWESTAHVTKITSSRPATYTTWSGVFCCRAGTWLFIGLLDPRTS